MRKDPFSVIIEPRPKSSGSGSNILNATYLTSNKINHVFRVTIKVVINTEFLPIGFAAESSPHTQKSTNLAPITTTL